LRSALGPAPLAPTALDGENRQDRKPDCYHSDCTDKPLHDSPPTQQMNSIARISFQLPCGIDSTHISFFMMRLLFSRWQKQTIDRDSPITFPSAQSRHRTAHWRFATLR